MRYQYCGSLLGCLISPMAWSDVTLEDLIELPLHQLTQITVNTASKREEPLVVTPGTMTVWKRNDIQRLGAYTLRELANLTQGYSTRSTLGRSILETRGLSDALNSRHLLLIDGIPVNHARDYMAFVDEQLPLIGAKQVEFLTGPASALYGTSAFSGVINIRPDEPELFGQSSEAAWTLGAQNSETRMMATTRSRNESGRFRATLGVYGKEASREEIPVDTPLRNRLQDQQDSNYADISYRFDSGLAQGVSLGFIHLSSTTGFGESWTNGIDTSEVNEEERITQIPYVKYQTSLSDTVDFNGYVKFNRSTESGTQTNSLWGSPFYFQFEAVTDNTEFLSEISWHPNTADHWIAGINLDRRRQDDGDSYIFDPSLPNNGDVPFFSATSETRSAYTQYAWQNPDLLSGLTVTLGVRFDDGQLDDNHYHQTSPRVAVVQRLTDVWSTKLLWGNALKAPGIKEVGHNQEKASTLVNPYDAKELIPETIATREAALIYADEKFVASMTVFELKIQDQLIEQAFSVDRYINPDNTPGLFRNIEGKTRSSGWEFSVNANLAQQTWCFVNLSRADTDSPQGSSVVDAPRHKFNLGLNQSWAQTTATLMARFVDDYSGGAGMPDYGGQTVWDFNAGITLSDNVAADVRITNLLDEHYYQSSSGDDGLPEPGRELFATLRVLF